MAELFDAEKTRVTESKKEKKKEECKPRDPALC